MPLNVFMRGVSYDDLYKRPGRGGESYALQNEPIFPFVENSHHNEEWRTLHGFVNSLWVATPVLVSTPTYAYIAYVESFQAIGRGEKWLWAAAHIPERRITYENLLTLVTYCLTADFVKCQLPADREVDIWKGFQSWPEFELDQKYRSLEEELHQQEPLQGGTQWIYRLHSNKGIVAPSQWDIMAIAYVLHKRLQDSEGKIPKVALIAGQNSDAFGHMYRPYAFHHQDQELQGIDWFVAEPTLEDRSISSYWEVFGPACDERIKQWHNRQEILQHQRFREEQLLREQELTQAQETWDQKPWHERLRLVLLNGERRP